MTWEALLNSPQPTAAGTALANSTTLTVISVAPQFTLPANFLQAGSALRFTAFGVFSTTVTPTLLLGVYYGGVAGVALATTGAITTGSGDERAVAARAHHGHPHDGHVGDDDVEIGRAHV